MNAVANKHSKDIKDVKAATAVAHQLGQDVRNAVLVASLVINVFVVTALLVVVVTHRYDSLFLAYFQNQNR